ncbi:MAG: carboxypeptidase regulatory-like domain-containing protein, partial [Candidatus Riflebacteria bacterium]|nr:carboxypeptidase regulatory-like domain-containing protein [Candidatus Riflebacteria bacterium]
MLRRSALLLTCLFVLSLAIIGCGGGGGGTANPAGPTASSVETASLSGTVLFDSVPLANASVYLYKSEKAPTIGMTQMPALRSSLIAQQLISDGAYSTTTNGAGVYSFTDVPVGQYTLIAVKDENHQFAQTGVLLGQVTSLDAQLTPTGKIGGRVTAMIGTSEQGAAAVFVYVSGTSYIALTDASGYFVINNVPSNALADSTAYEVAVMPGKGTASPVTGVVVNPGETTNIGTISLSQQTEGYKEIAGKFVAGAGATSADIVDQFVILAAEVDGVLIGTSTDSTGSYSFFVNRLGRYYVMPTEGFLDFAPASQTVTVTALDNTTENLADFVLSHIQTGGSVVAGNVTWPAITDWTFT